MPPAMARLLSRNETLNIAWGVWALLLGMGLLMVGNGLQGTLLGVRASAEGFGATVTGLVMSGYFVGFLAGSTATPPLVERVGHVRVFAALASLASVAILVHSLFVIPVVWAAMRLVTGFAFAGLYVVTESWLNDRATNETRGRLLAIYLGLAFMGMGGGQLLLNVADPANHDMFILVSLIVSLALIPILLSATSQPRTDSPDTMGLRRLLRAAPLGSVTCFASGMGSGAIFGMGAVYAREVGLSLAEISVFMAAAIGGGALLQWPIGRISDRIDRRIVITVVAALGVALSLAAIPVADLSRVGLIALAACIGGVILPLYSLSLAYTNDYLEPRQMLAASSTLVMIMGIGSILGPSLTGWLMDLFGPAGFLWYLAAVHAALVAFALYRMVRRPRTDEYEASRYVVAPSRFAPMGAAYAEQAGYGEEESEAGPER